MNTNNKALCNSSWGRIWLMLRADVIGNKSTIMVLYGAMLAVLFFVPRIPLIFGVQYGHWLGDWVSIYSLDVVRAILSMVTMVYIFIYINRRTQHQQPMIFSTLPMQLWEKFVAMNLYFILLSIIGFCVSILELALEVATVPGITFAALQSISVLPLSDIYRYEVGMHLGSFGEFSVVLSLLLLNLFVYFLMWFNASKMRNAFLGLVAMWFEILGIILLTIGGIVAIFQNFINDFFFSYIIESKSWVIFLIFNVYSLILACIAGFLVYKRLRSIEY